MWDVFSMTFDSLQDLKNEEVLAVVTVVWHGAFSTCLARQHSGKWIGIKVMAEMVTDTP